MAKPKQALSKDRILEAAIPLLEERGVEGLTMRALSDKLGVALGATYKHVANKNALLRLIADDLYEKILTKDAGGDDLEQIEEMLLEIANTFDRYPGMAAYVAMHMDEFQSVEVSERIMGSLQRVGLSREDAGVRVIALITFISGHLLIDLGDEYAQESAAAYQFGVSQLLAGLRKGKSQRR